MPDSIVYTDEWGGYAGLGNVNRYQHRRVNHSAGVYVVAQHPRADHRRLLEPCEAWIGALYHRSTRSICSPTWTNTPIAITGATLAFLCLFLFWMRLQSR
jgi:hypothetical protein